MITTDELDVNTPEKSLSRGKNKMNISEKKMEKP
jgi:hypothetical protein